MDHLSSVRLNRARNTYTRLIDVKILTCVFPVLVHFEPVVDGHVLRTAIGSAVRVDISSHSVGRRQVALSIHGGTGLPVRVDLRVPERGDA